MGVYYQGSVELSPAVGVDGTIYVGSDDYNLYAINPDGSQQWAFLTGSEVFASPAIGTDGTIYVGSLDNNLYAVNPDGTQKWVFPTDIIIASAAAIAGGRYHLFLVVTTTTCMPSIRTAHKSGALPPVARSIPPRPSGRTAPSISARVTRICMPSIRTVPKSGHSGPGHYVWSTPALGADGTVYVGSNDGYLYAINPDGSQKWAFNAGRGSSPLRPSMGTALSISGSEDNNLYALNPDGSKKWSFATMNSDRLFTGHRDEWRRLIGSDDDNLYAITNGFLLTPSAGANGTITPSAPQAVLPNSSFTFTASANTGYTVNIWSIDGTVVRTAARNVHADKHHRQPHRLGDLHADLYRHAECRCQWRDQPDTVQTVALGSNMTFTATPNTGYAVSTWLLDSVAVQTGGTTYTLSNITANHTVWVTFGTAFTVTPSACANGTISPSTAVAVASGTTSLYRHPEHRIYGEYLVG